MIRHDLRSADELVDEDFVLDAYGVNDGGEALVDAVAGPLVGLIADLDRLLWAGRRWPGSCRDAERTSGAGYSMGSS